MKIDDYELSGLNGIARRFGIFTLFSLLNRELETIKKIGKGSKETESETEKQSETEPKKPTTPGIVKTGDPTDFLPPSLGVIAGLVLFAGALASGTRKKKRHTQEQ